MQVSQEHLCKSLDHWSHVIWSDESSFNLFGLRGQLVWWHIGERFDAKYVVAIVKHDRGFLIVWGMLKSHGPGPLYRVEGNLWIKQYIKILEEVMLPAAHDLLANNFVFQEDNVMVFKVRNVQFHCRTQCHCIKMVTQISRPEPN